MGQSYRERLLRSTWNRWLRIVVSHDRWFLDRTATHILAFEGDSKVVLHDGNFTSYEEAKHKRLGKDADQPHRIKYRKLTK